MFRITLRLIWVVAEFLMLLVVIRSLSLLLLEFKLGVSVWGWLRSLSTAYFSALWWLAEARETTSGRFSLSPYDGSSGARLAIEHRVPVCVWLLWLFRIYKTAARSCIFSALVLLPGWSHDILEGARLLPRPLGARLAIDLTLIWRIVTGV